MNALLMGLFGDGGLLRVRAILAFFLTAGGVVYLLLHQAVPPGEYLVLWTAAVTYYFGTRSSAT